MHFEAPMIFRLREPKWPSALEGSLFEPQPKFLRPQRSFFWKSCDDARSSGLRRNAQGIVAMPKKTNGYATGAYSNAMRST